MHVMLPNNTLKALALGTANHIHHIARRELRYVQVESALNDRSIRQPELGDATFRLRPRFLKMPKHRLRHALFFLSIEADLHSTVTVFLVGLDLRRSVPARLDNSHGGSLPLVVIDAGHPQFFA